MRPYRQQVAGSAGGVFPSDQLSACSSPNNSSLTVTWAELELVPSWGGPEARGDTSTCRTVAHLPHPLRERGALGGTRAAPSCRSGTGVPPAKAKKIFRASPKPVCRTAPGQKEPRGIVTSNPPPCRVQGRIALEEGAEL